MDEPISLASRRVEESGDNSDWSPADCLQDSLREVRSGARAATSCLVLFLDDTDGYSIGWCASNLSSTQMIALMESIKITLLRDMGMT